jgi:hypothetical protein
MTTGLKHARENDRDLMTRLRAKYGPNYNPENAAAQRLALATRQGEALAFF